MGLGEVVRVMTAECPTTSDGRPMHYFTKVSGVFTCDNCGETR